MNITINKELATINKFYAAETPVDALFSQSEAKIILPMSSAWYERARVYGGGPLFLKIGSRVFYRKGDLLEFISKNKIVSSTSSVEG